MCEAHEAAGLTMSKRKAGSAESTGDSMDRQMAKRMDDVFDRLRDGGRSMQLDPKVVLELLDQLNAVWTPPLCSKRFRMSVWK